MDYYANCKQFGGCPANDEVNTKSIDPEKFYIINMSKRSEGGSHWVLLFRDIYFDSFGCPPTLAVQRFTRVYNDVAYQDFSSAACGFYCIYVADKLLQGRPPTEGLIPDDEETNHKSSELVLQRYFS